jgi:hypothetical protein
MDEPSTTYDEFRELGVFMRRESATDLFDGIRRLEVVSAGGEDKIDGRWSWSILQDAAGAWHFHVCEECFPPETLRLDRADLYDGATDDEADVLRLVAHRLLAAIALHQGEPQRLWPIICDQPRKD